MGKQYSVGETFNVAARASTEIETWLRYQPVTISVRNVENYKDYQKRDIDLLWTTKKKVYTVEIKGDRYHHTGNFFFETHSNVEFNTVGCFLYSEADLFFYYYIDVRELYILPMPTTRDWFLANQESFAVRETRTPVRSSYYTTQGRLVPRKTVIANVKDVVRRKL